ncbi:hypothetical protein [Marinobacter nauticus]|nr:hypothetical protein [Marinobacter nauticus]RKR72498.1 hypothetical protein C7436_2859 [Marinobacter nauticus]
MTETLSAYLRNVDYPEAATIRLHYLRVKPNTISHRPENRLRE